MKYCKKCLQPDTRPKVYFDENGVCGACLWEEEKKQIDWEQRENELKEIAEWAKQEGEKRGTYDCIVGVSGGKDSTLQALYARDKLGLNCLLVNVAPAQITEVGKHNIDNLWSLGFDMFTIKVNPIILKKLMKKDFKKYLNKSRTTDGPMWASVHQVALALNVPLIIQGENAALTLGVREGRNVDGDASQVYKCNTMSGGDRFKEYVGYEGVREKDILLYQFPNPELLEKADIKSIWLQYYVKEWSQAANAEFAIKHGLHVRTDSLEEIGRLHKHTCLDSDFHIVNQLFKYVKLGFGFATDEACYDIREGRLSREKGIELVSKYDGKCGEKYIKMFCDYIDIDIEEFWKVVDEFRNKKLFTKIDGKWEPKFVVGEDFNE